MEQGGNPSIMDMRRANRAHIKKIVAQNNQLTCFTLLQSGCRSRRAGEGGKGEGGASVVIVTGRCNTLAMALGLNEGPEECEAPACLIISFTTSNSADVRTSGGTIRARR